MTHRNLYKLSATLLAGAAFALASLPAQAQDFPDRAIEIIVPYAAGGGTDLSVRVLADVLSTHLDGATVIVRNEPGGGGANGPRAAPSAAAHG